MRTLNFKATRVFNETQKAKTRFVVNEGGARSSKTFSIAQVIILKMLELQNDPACIGVVRKTLPALKATAMRDFFYLLEKYKLYDVKNHNKSDQTYHIGKCFVEFFSVDDEQKVRGRKRDYLWINEANELTYDDFFQLNIRTTKQVFLDYNPSDIVSWIYDNVTSQQDCTVIHSTYLDNPFLEPSLVQTIESIKDQDEELWKIYGLGQRVQSRKTIYTNWDTIARFPEKVDEIFYGLDFGFNNPSAILKIGIRDNELYEEELLYQTHLNNSQLIEQMKQLMPLSAEGYADSAEPQRINEINLAGFVRIVGADKSVKPKIQIDVVKRYKIHIVQSSVNLINEKKLYHWKKDKDGNLLDEPVKFNDHLMDAERYAIYTKLVQEVRPSLLNQDAQIENDEGEMVDVTDYTQFYNAERRRKW